MAHGIDQKVVAISWDMWEHRNQTKHSPANGAAMEENEQLHALIIQELHLGAAEVSKQHRKHQ